MMKQPAVLAAVGAVAGVVVALALFMFVLGGGKQAAAGPIAQPTVVAVPGKIGPHITLADRIFNLQSKTPAYLKLQTVVEFETTDARWAAALTGCAGVLPAGAAEALYVSADPALVGGRTAAVGPRSGSAASSPCEVQQQTLEDEFTAHIGNGAQLMEDAVTTIVTAKTPDEISTPAGKEALKAEIQAAVQKLLPDEHVKRVLFVDFITQ